MPPLTIGIEASPLGYPAGGGLRSFLHYALREVARLDQENRYVLYTTASTTDDMLPVPVGPGSRWQMCRASGPTAIRPTLWLQAGFRKASASHGLDVLWLTRHVPPLSVRDVPFVATVFDLLYHHVPDALSWSLRLTNKFFLEAIARKASRIIATSHATARDLVTVLGVDPERISVAHGGVDTDHFYPRDKQRALDYVKRQLGVDRPFILALEAFVGRKNFERQLEAYRLLPKDLRQTFPVIATGRRRRHARHVDVEGAVRRLGLEASVRLVDHVDHKDMPMLYSAAALLTFVSQYEGFGLPIIEAMACGCPVLTGDRFSMPEAGGRAALYAPPDDPSAIAKQMARALTDAAEGDRMRSLGLVHVKGFTWSGFAEKTLSAIRQAAEER